MPTYTDSEWGLGATVTINYAIYTDSEWGLGAPTTIHDPTYYIDSNWGLGTSTTLTPPTVYHYWYRAAGVKRPLVLRSSSPAGQRDLLTIGSFFPDETTTGVYDWSVLEDVNSTLIVTTAGATYTNKRFLDKVHVRAPGVHFRNCAFLGPEAVGSGGTTIIATNPAVSNLLIEDCTIAPRAISDITNCVEGHHFTLRRVNIYHGVDGVSVIAADGSTRADVVIEGSWIHDLTMYNTTTQSDNLTHNDVIQWHGMLGLTITGSRLEGFCDPSIGVVNTPPTGVWPNSLVSGNPWYPTGWSTSVLMCSPARAPMGELVITNNWMNGGAVALNLSGTSTANLPGATVTGNRFGYEYRNGHDFGVLARADQVLTLTGNHRWNAADPWDTSIVFNVRKNG